MSSNLTQLSKPHFHLFVGLEDDFETYFDHFKEEFSKIQSYYIEGRRCRTTDYLLRQFSSNLKFGLHYTYTWPGFYEIMSEDLEWEDWDGFAIFIMNYDLVMKDEENIEGFGFDYQNKVFTELMIEIAEEWAVGRNYNPTFPTLPRSFHVIYHCEKEKERETVARLKKYGLHEFDITYLDEITTN
ncbi:barstar family protein [Hazenella sp. IB182357]|uniref:Barstar family protein n=1 Tax=Polycladospora coralii TaxID=2771432 RepID=A0A926RXP0_9BACL|nr:barstar family protein [Polycladospora coralii]MBD1372706.1 barstar family protein [Polycladospora coralii]